MGGSTHIDKPNVNNYIYDSSFIVSGARDYARAAFAAAMMTAQVMIQPIYETMFSSMLPNSKLVYHMNCRLPHHMDTSYSAYLQRVENTNDRPVPGINGPNLLNYVGRPKKVLQPYVLEPDFRPPTPKEISGPTVPKNRGMQTVYRESSAQTKPWQPDGVAASECEETPEVLYLDKLEWGPGKPYRLGDLPADFHTTEIINKMRHARQWTAYAEVGKFPYGVKHRDNIIVDIETKDWIFRETEIDELQAIRLELMHQLKEKINKKKATKTSTKLARRWENNKKEMNKKFESIRKSTDREMRKLISSYESGGKIGMVQKLRASRGGGSVTSSAADPSSDLHAPLARHGYQAKRRHAKIEYDFNFLLQEDHEAIAKPPNWVYTCAFDLKKSCSGTIVPQDKNMACERETKWSEHYLEQLHNDLKKARLGAANIKADKLHILELRHIPKPPRPSTPTVDAVDDDDEEVYQAALQLQRIIRGRAVQNLMYEGRRRAAELTEELKTTHGLQKEDKARIAREETKARDFEVKRSMIEQKEDTVTCLVDKLCGGAVASALDFLEKELRRLKDERKQHAFILIALREKAMREAAEAGRRQREEKRRREHDEMFRKVLGMTQETVDLYLQEIVTDGVAAGAEKHAAAMARMQADRIDASMRKHGSMSTAEQNELVAELVQQYLLPEAHKIAARQKLENEQKYNLKNARQSIFNLLEESVVEPKQCIQCGMPLDDNCHCANCGVLVGRGEPVPTETEHRYDPRWDVILSDPAPPEKTISEMFPLKYDVRRLVDAVVDDVPPISRTHRQEIQVIRTDCHIGLFEKIDVKLDMKEFINAAIDIACGCYEPPPKEQDQKHYSLRILKDAIDYEPKKKTETSELPTSIRYKEAVEEEKAKPWCKCEPVVYPEGVVPPELMTPQERAALLPSQLRYLEGLRRCKCDCEPSLERGTLSYHEEEDRYTTHSTSSGFEE